MSYDEDLVIVADTDEELDEQNNTSDDELDVIDVVDKSTSKQRQVSTRRRVEDILAEKLYKEMYGDIFDEF